jgi:hypothetical protein
MSDASQLQVAADVVASVGGSVLLLLPGWVTTTVYRRGVPGPDQPERTLLLQYAFSGIIVHVLLLGWTLSLLRTLIANPTDHVVATITWALVVLILVPAVLGLVFGYALDLVEKLPSNWTATRDIVGRLGVSASVRTPDAWTRTWRTIKELNREIYVRVRKTDGSLVLGRWGTRSLASSDPRTRDLYLEQLWADDNGDEWFHHAFEDSAGIWISGDQIAGIEFFPADRP